MKWLVGCTAAMCVRDLEFLTTEKQGSVGVTDIEVGGVEVSSLIYYLTSEGKTGVFFFDIFVPAPHNRNPYEQVRKARLLMRCICFSEASFCFTICLLQP